MLIQELLFRSVDERPEHPALVYRGMSRSYAELAEDVRAFGRGLYHLGLSPRDRVAVFLDKQLETPVAILGTAAAGLTFVPVNPVLRAAQIAYIMNDCNVRVLVTTRARLSALETVLDDCPDLQRIVVVDAETTESPLAGNSQAARAGGLAEESFASLMARGQQAAEGAHAVLPTEMAGILYTSGSTGNPKGVVFSHRNFVAGAQSVSQFLRYQANERVINIPPYSFDFGLNQLLSSLCAGVTAVLHNFMTPQELMKTIAAEKVTGVSGVPTVMIQLAAQDWPPALVDQIRYMSTTGGRVPEQAVRSLRRALPKTDLYLMYGLTEAFRATYLPPSEVDRRPGSVGKAIPGAEVLVVRPDGTICDADEPGELVQKGVLVTLGYWNDPVRTAERFKPAPGVPAGAPDPELAVYSGDTVKRDAEGFIYYVGRNDEMIKTSGYRISPTEIEEAVFATGRVSVAAAVGVEDETLGQAIVVFVTPKPGRPFDPVAILEHCRKTLPAYMVLQRLIERETMPLNPNGKVDRKRLGAEYAEELAAAPDSVSAAESREPVETDSFLSRWRSEFAELLGLRRRRFETVMDVFCWSFPDRKISPRDTFISLSGDSLTYVTVSLGLDELVPKLPEDWAERSIVELQALCGSEAAAGTVIRPDILLRVVAMFGVVLSHTSLWTPGGASKLMMLISGLSFARFTWNEDPRRTLWSALRFTINIVIPTLIFLAVAFAALERIDWPVLLFVDNLVSPSMPAWWPPAWYIECLFQYLILMVGLGFVPGVATLAARRKYLFGVALTVAGVAAYVGFRLQAPSELADYDFMPQYFFWLFAFGWLMSAAETRNQKLGVFALLLVSIGAVLAANTVTRLGAYNDVFWAWLLAGAAVLLTGWSFSAPRWVNVAVVTLARPMLFVYLLHTPLGALAPVPRMKTAVGFFASLVIWAVWESLSRTVASYWPHNLGDTPKMGERGSKTGEPADGSYRSGSWRRWQVLIPPPLDRMPLRRGASGGGAVRQRGAADQASGSTGR